MTKIYIKLIAMALALTLSVSVVIMSSYAWMVLSGNPAATGIQVAIGGGNTILIAPNVTEKIDGKTYNYPGYFSDSLNFGQRSEYDYLTELAGLTPVSTSNGIDWFISQKDVDSELKNANISVKDEGYQEKLKEGSYIYLDFWVVSPSGEHTLRVSTGKEDYNGGSFVIDLPSPKETENGYELQPSEGSAAASVRIGFLANDIKLMDETMNIYAGKDYYNKNYTSLRGMYQEPLSGTSYLEADKFTIYEPNADYHPGKPELDGTYIVTEPLSLREDINLWEHLTVQLNSSWTLPESGEGTRLDQMFNTVKLGSAGNWKSEEEAFAAFYGRSLQGQIAPYVTKGDFIKNTGYLAEELGEKEEIFISGAYKNKAGATDDVSIIKLERNVPQRIRMFVWVEAQDFDCPASAKSARFAVNIEFAGETEK